MWQCPQCKETIADGFDACWNCGTGPTGVAPSAFVPEPDDASAPDPGPSPEDLVVASAQKPLQANATKRAWPQFTIRSLLLLTAAVAAVLGCWQWSRGPRYSLPRPDDVLSMKVLGFFDGLGYRPEIEVSEKHRKEILAALSPSEYDPSPRKWQILAAIEIQTKHNQRYRVDAYDRFHEPIGAFSVGPTFEERTYRRGGNSGRLKKAIEEAYAESATRNGATPSGP